MQLKYPKIWQLEDDTIDSYYTGLLKKYGISTQSLDWGGKNSQELRFRVFSEIGDLNGCSVLDVGCGLADFNKWLVKNGILVKYSGIDITAAMIEKAILRFPELSLSVTNLLTDFPGKENEFDYVFASGIFYRRSKGRYKFLEDMVRQMYRLCSIGMAFNTLSVWSKDKNGVEFYADPVKIIDVCKKITHKIIFRHDYLPNDFTICLFK